ncbi:MAG: hypothetical protein GX371_02915 [Bacteroidales bacterium]|nr:hypothetical protein [Bacteroidales bacterium]
MSRIMLFFLFICIVELHAQQSIASKTAQVDSLLELAYQSYASMEINSSLSHALEALSLSEDINYSKGKVRGNFYVAQVFWSLGDYGKTIDYLQLAENEKYVESDLILSSEICRVKGRAYGSLKLYDLSITEFRKGLDYIKQIKTPFERQYLTSLAYDNLSHTYTLQDETDSTLLYLNKNQKILNTMDEARVFRNLINLYGHLGKTYARQDDYERATGYFTDALRLAETNNFPYTSWIYLQWGNMKLRQDSLYPAIEKYQAGLENLEQTNLRVELPDIYTALRDAYIQIEQHDSAMVYHQKKTEIEAELSEANRQALDKAVQLLLVNEKGQQTTQLIKVRVIAFIAVLLTLVIAFVIWVRWKRRYRQVTEKKQKLTEKLEEKMGDALDEIVELARSNDSSFLPRFMEFFPNFTRNFFTQHPDLPQSSFQFSAYIFLHFSSKEIADIMFVEHKSVQTRKNRLRKQLELPRNTDLYQYMRWLDEHEESDDTSLHADSEVMSVTSKY